jgi:DNA-binding transcriptional regulator of glucitol operon
MAHSHYVMDLYYPQGSDPDRFRREVLRIDAKDDEAAEAEGRRVGAWRKPAYFVMRSIQTSARNREREIFDSRSEQAAVTETPPDSAPETPDPDPAAESAETRT